MRPPITEAEVFASALRDGVRSNHLSPFKQESVWIQENESNRWTSGQHFAVHVGGETVSHFGWIHPLLPGAEGLLGGPTIQDESLWAQHTHNICALEPT